jgi:hypothetical protein
MTGIYPISDGGGRSIPDAGGRSIAVRRWPLTPSTLRLLLSKSIIQSRMSSWSILFRASASQRMDWRLKEASLLAAIRERAQDPARYRDSGRESRRPDRAIPAEGGCALRQLRT